METTEATKTTGAPHWIRLPRAGTVCPHSGLKRGQLLKLASNRDSKIKVCHLRERGAKRGTRLIDLESLLAYLDRRAAESMEEASR